MARPQMVVAVAACVMAALVALATVRAAAEVVAVLLAVTIRQAGAVARAILLVTLMAAVKRGKLVRADMVAPV